MMDVKACIKCKEEKPNTFTYYTKDGKGNILNVCKLCVNLRLKEYKRKKRIGMEDKRYGIKEDLTNKKFNNLTVLALSEKKEGGKSYWICKCDCEAIVIVQGYILKKLKQMGCNECGNKLISIKNRRHNDMGTRLYETWTNMKTRCSNTKYSMYKDYGGKGISVCKEWIDYLDFKKWAIKSGYSEDLTLDRIDNDKNYYPENCRWSTMKEQQNNRTNNHLITYNGLTLTMMQWSERNNLVYGTLQRRIYSGWDIERALTKRGRT